METSGEGRPEEPDAGPQGSLHSRVPVPGSPSPRAWSLGQVMVSREQPLPAVLSLRFLLMMGVLFCCGAGFFIRRRMYPPPLIEEPAFNVSYTRQPPNPAPGQPSPLSSSLLSVLFVSPASVRKGPCYHVGWKQKFRPRVFISVLLISLTVCLR